MVSSCFYLSHLPVNFYKGHRTKLMGQKYIQGGFLTVPPDFLCQNENDLQPTWATFSSNFQCEKAPRRLIKFPSPHFGHENGEKYLRKTPCRTTENNLIQKMIMNSLNLNNQSATCIFDFSRYGCISVSSQKITMNWEPVDALGKWKWNETVPDKRKETACGSVLLQNFFVDWEENITLFKNSIFSGNKRKSSP